MGKKKKIMRIAISSRFITFNNKYNVHWGSTGKAYNRNHKSFKSRKQAVKFKNQLVRKYKKLGYKVEYMYLAD